jgi:molybdopterin-guanine dinucleotide biosynthesis protein A
VIGIAEESPAHVVVPQIGDLLQPLCAVYKRGFAAVAERALREGRNRITALFEAESTRIIKENEIASAGFSPEMFHNVNTPDDWEQARRSLTLESR